MSRRRDHLQHRIQQAVDSGDATNPWEESELAALETAITTLRSNEAPSKELSRPPLTVMEGTAIAAGALSILTELLHASPQDTYTIAIRAFMVGAATTALTKRLPRSAQILSLGVSVAGVMLGLAGVAPAASLGLAMGALMMELASTWIKLRQNGSPATIGTVIDTYFHQAKSLMMGRKQR
ncbi:MAG: hypothetical protein U5L74_13420 [Ideonella sp.]|nr:hypothetical protein [Ideonella sp.]